RPKKDYGNEIGRFRKARVVGRIHECSQNGSPLQKKRYETKRDHEYPCAHDQAVFLRPALYAHQSPDEPCGAARRMLALNKRLRSPLSRHRYLRLSNVGGAPRGSLHITIVLITPHLLHDRAAPRLRSLARVETTNAPHC